MTATLIKVDRNGSKHWIKQCTCERCNGRGWYATGVMNGQLIPSRVDNAVCYECHGTGTVERKVIERTPEYEAKLEERRQVKQAKQQAEHLAKLNENRVKWLTSHGFTADGLTYIFLGDTYKLKDQLKELGAKFNISIGWHIDHEVNGFQFITANIHELGKETYNGYEITAVRAEWDAKKKQALIDLGITKQSSYVGEIGKRLKLKVKYIRSSWFESSFWGNVVTTYIHKFVDTDNNVFIWKTTNGICEEYDTEFTLVGTVKEHSEYDGEKQTVLTRCKYEEV